MKGVSGQDNKLLKAQEEKVRDVIKENLTKEEILSIFEFHSYLSQAFGVKIGAVAD